MLSDLKNVLPGMLTHIFIKKNQAAYFKQLIESRHSMVIQVDYAENYHIFNQNQTQQAHYGYSQVSELND